MKIIVLSDTHGFHDMLEIPDGDVLVHCGDFSMLGQQDELRAFNEFLGELPHAHKLVVAGNHDYCFQNAREQSVKLLSHGVYLQDTCLLVDGIKFYGSPWQPEFMRMAFNLTEDELAKKWALIPDDTDVLITHTPPAGVRDLNSKGERKGSTSLRETVNRLSVSHHFFGHIHEGYGVEVIDGKKYVNACNCDIDFQPINPPVVVSVAN